MTLLWNSSVLLMECNVVFFVCNVLMCAFLKFCVDFLCKLKFCLVLIVGSFIMGFAFLVL